MTNMEALNKKVKELQTKQKEAADKLVRHFYQEVQQILGEDFSPVEVINFLKENWNTGRGKEEKNTKPFRDKKTTVPSQKVPQHQQENINP